MNVWEDPKALEHLISSAMKTQEFEKAIGQNVMQLVAKATAEQAYQTYLYGASEIEVLSDSDILSRNSPSWIVHGLVPESTIVEIAGPGGIGKTFFTLALSRAVASGQMFFDRPVTQGKVLYVAAEGTAAFGDRVRAWNDVNATTGRELSDMHYVEKGVNLSDLASVDKLCDIISTGGYRLIILDTFSQLSHIENENDAAKTALVFRNIKKLRDANPGSSVVVVHHTNAQGGKARGSTVHRDNVDVLAIVSGDSEGFWVSTRLEDGGKFKDGEAKRWDGFSLTASGKSAVVVHSDGKRVSRFWEPVQAVLADGDWHPGTALRDACGIAESKGSEYQAFARDLNNWTSASGPLEKSGPKTRPVYRATPVPGGVS